MSKRIVFFLILSFGMSCSCQSTSSASNDTENIDLTDTTYFEIVRNYIFDNGTIEKVNISSNLSKERIIDYHIIMVDNWKTIIDHSDRIYMTLNDLKYGNVLKENSSVKPEINYGVPDTNPQRTKEKEIQVLKNYNQLILLALNKGN